MREHRTAGWVSGFQETDAKPCTPVESQGRRGVLSFLQRNIGNIEVYNTTFSETLCTRFCRAF